MCKPVQVDEYQAVRSIGGISYIDMTKNAKGELTFTDSQLIDGIFQPASRTTATTAAITYVYDIQGRRLPRAQRGINIIRNADGSVRKVISW